MSLPPTLAGTPAYAVDSRVDPNVDASKTPSGERGIEVSRVVSLAKLNEGDILRTLHGTIQNPFLSDKIHRETTTKRILAPPLENLAAPSSIDRICSCWERSRKPFSNSGPMI